MKRALGLREGKRDARNKDVKHWVGSVFSHPGPNSLRIHCGFEETSYM